MSGRWEPVYAGMPWSSSRGALGWSAVLLGRSPDGRVALFDTGGPGDRLTLPGRLADRGLRVDDVGVVVLSHLHFDHAANWDLFRTAEIVLGEEELAHAEQGDDWAVLRHVVDPLERTGRLRAVRGVHPLDDGLVVVPAPGHTPGSIALATGDRGRTLLCGDALKDRWQLGTALARPPTERDRVEQSVATLAARADVLWPGHDGPLERRGDSWCAGDDETVRLERRDGRCAEVTRGTGTAEVVGLDAARGTDGGPAA